MCSRSVSGRSDRFQSLLAARGLILCVFSDNWVPAVGLNTEACCCGASFPEFLRDFCRMAARGKNAEVFYYPEVRGCREEFRKGHQDKPFCLVLYQDFSFFIKPNLIKNTLCNVPNMKVCSICQYNVYNILKTLQSLVGACYIQYTNNIQINNNNNKEIISGLRQGFSKG